MAQINLINKNIRGYTLTEKLGSGAFGTVYKAIKTNVAGKYIRALKHISIPTEREYHTILSSMGGDTSKTDNYFDQVFNTVKSEIEILNDLSEKGVQNIVRYYENDVFVTDMPKRYDIYILMEYLTPLEDYIQSREFRVRDVVKLGLDVLSGLQACHDNGIIHRDIKDENIFVSDEGEYKIGDFGVSKILKDTSRAASVKGTPNFLAPEVYLGKEGYTKSVDLYSLGILLYRRLNYDRNPFLPRFPEQYFAKDEEEAFAERMSGKTPGFPLLGGEEIGRVIVKAISNQRERFQTAEEFICALETAWNRTSKEALDTGVKINIPHDESTAMQGQLTPTLKETIPELVSEEETFEDEESNLLNKHVFNGTFSVAESPRTEKTKEKQVSRQAAGAFSAEKKVQVVYTPSESLTTNKRLDKVEDVLAEINRLFGINALTDEQQLIANFSELAPHLSKQQRILGYFAECNGPKKIIAVMDASEDEKGACVRQIVQEMKDEMYIEETASRRICEAFLFAVSGQSLNRTSVESQTVTKIEQSAATPAVTKQQVTHDPTAEEAYQKAEEYYNGSRTSNFEAIDRQNAFEWYQKAADKGHAGAQYKLGVCYDLGKGVIKDKKKAAHCYELSAKQGYAKAQFNLGVCYKLGEGVPQNEQSAVYWYQLSAMQGNADAQCNLGVCYESGTGVGKDEQRATYWYELAAKQGHARAQYNLGVCYENGRGVTKNEQKAVYWYELSAKHGHARAQCSLGVCYGAGKGVMKDVQKAVYWYKQSAQQGHSDAQCKLGVCYGNGICVETDEKKAAYWFEQSAKQGNAAAQYNLGICYGFGKGVEKDEYQATYWFEQSAQQGYASAQFNLGVSYELGKGVAKNEQKAVYWYEQSAKQGNADAQCKLGDCYFIGKGVAEDEQKAAYWYEQSAKQGNVDAQCRLGVCYEYGRGVRKNEQKAVYWYELAAKQGNADAQCNLGACYGDGRGIMKDGGKAVYWFEQSAQQGCSDAQYILGICYDYGRCVEKDEQKAVYWYELAAKQDDARAQYDLGVCYAHGRGVRKDEQRAAYWYEQSAKQGNADAQCNLGVCYDHGRGVRKDEQRAAYWYEQSAKQGNARAQCNLGVCYDHGRGVRKDKRKADYWYKLAAQQGNARAQRKVGLQG